MEGLCKKIESVIKTGKTCLVRVYGLYKGRERYVSYGNENQDKVFYIIGQDDTGGGLFWLVNKAVMHIAYAVENGWIPVVDYKNHITQYTLDSLYRTNNFWEIFFTQPCGYSLIDIRYSKHVVIQRMFPAPQEKYLMGQAEFYENEDRIDYFRRYFSKYVHFNDSTSIYLQKTYERLLADKQPVVGVLCRGTDYVLKRPKGHYVQPEPEVVIKDVLEVQQQYHCQYVFLATEDADIFQTFHEVFGDNLISLPQKRISKSSMDRDQFLSDQSSWHEENDPIEKARAYLASMYLLSRCDCFLSGRTGGAKAVLLMTKGFEFKKIYNLGFY